MRKISVTERAYIAGFLDGDGSIYVRLKPNKLKILDRKKRISTARNFLKLCKLVDQFKSLNYSKRRVQMAPAVEKTLLREGLLTP